MFLTIEGKFYPYNTVESELMAFESQNLECLKLRNQIQMWELVEKCDFQSHIYEVGKNLLP